MLLCLLSEELSALGHTMALMAVYMWRKLPSHEVCDETCYKQLPRSANVPRTVVVVAY